MPLCHWSFDLRSLSDLISGLVSVLLVYPAARIETDLVLNIQQNK